MEGEKKFDMDFSEIPMTYGVVFMKESPSLFKNSESFIHYKKDVTDTGIALPMLAKIVYIELDKCLYMLQENTCPEKYKELGFWLAFMADVNSEYAINLAKTREEFGAIRQELYSMSKNREEMLGMLADKYGEAIRYSEMQEAKRKGRAEGIAEGIAEGEVLKTIELIQRKLQKGKPIEIIADELEIEISEIQAIADVISICPPGCDREEIYRKLTEK